MIHPSAIIESGAEIGEGVSIGPYAVIGPHVRIGERTKIGSHAVISGHTEIGPDNQIFQFTSIGEIPQDKKYAGEPTRLKIGARNTIREFCTLNIGTAQDAGVTRIGDDNWIMAYVHIAHDCQIGNHTIFANNASLAGHVHISDHVVLGGFTLVHQFCRIGAHALCAIGTITFQDIPPYVTAAGASAAPHGINSEGLRRRGFSAEAITQIKRAYKTLYKSGLSFDEARKEIAARAHEVPELEVLAQFLAEPGRGIIR